MAVLALAGWVVVERGSTGTGTPTVGAGTTATGSSSVGSTSAPSTSRPATSTSTSTSTTTSTTSTSTTTTSTLPPHEGLIPGDSGEQVVALQGALTALGYWNGDPDGAYGVLVQQAVMAFQKVAGLSTDGSAGPDTLAAIATAGRPEARTTEGDAIEVDLERQIVLVVRGGAVEWAFNSSTGKAGWETPPGSYSVYRMVDGVDPGPYGSLYRPAYFLGGYAVHGAGVIPSAPASHGCARLTNAAMDLLWAEGLSPGMPVEVY